MAGDWMKIETTTPDKPEVVKIATLLDIDQDAVAGKLLRLWAWADANCIDGHAIDVTPAFLDRLTHCPGFTRAMIAVGWLIEDQSGGLTFPNFQRHNGTTAKARAESNRRMTKLRSSRHTGDAMVTEKASPKPSPEKRREEDSSSNNNHGSSDTHGDPFPAPPPATYEIPRSPEPAAPDPAIATAEEILRYGRSLPMPFVPAAATAFHDTMQACGWTSKHGQPIRDWRAAFRRYLSAWNDHERRQHLHQQRRQPPGRGSPAATLEPMEWER